MKVITTFETLTTLSASTSDASFPVANVAITDPWRRWKATGNVNEWVKVDFGSAKSLTALFLNNCNFTTATIQGNATDAWGAPSFTQAITLGLDDAGNRKGWFDLSAFNYRYLRVYVPTQTLDLSETKVAIGNLIAGTSATVTISQWQADLITTYMTFQGDGGSYSKVPKGRQRHVFSASMANSLSNIDALARTWTNAVLFEDLGAAAGSWLVFRPDNFSKSVKSTNDAEMRFVLEEAV